MSKDFSTVVDDFQPEPTGSRGPRGVNFNIKRLITMRLPIMLAIGLVLSIPASLVVWKLTPVHYTATTQIRFKAQQPTMLSEDRQARPGNYDQFVATEINTIKGDTILTRVSEDPAVRALPSIQGQLDKLGFLRSRIFASAQRQGELAQVSCTMKKSDDARLILETVIDKYREYLSQRQSEERLNRTKFLTVSRDQFDAQLKEISNNIVDLEIKMGGGSDTGIRDTEEDKLYRENLIAAQAEQSQIQSKIEDLSEQLERIEFHLAEVSNSPSKKIFEFKVEAQVGSDSRVSGHRQDLVAAESRLAQMKQTQRDNARLRNEEKKVNTLRGEVSRIEQQVRQEVLASVRGSYEEELKNAENALEEANGRVEQYQAQLDTFMAEFETMAQDLAEDIAKLNSLKSKHDDVNSQLAEIQSSLNLLNLEEKAPARIEFSSEITVPPLPDGTKRILGALMAIVFSFGVGAAVGVLLELLDRNVRTPQDLSFATHHQVIACIPHSSEDKKLNSKNELPLVTAEYPNSLAADEFRRVMARMLYPVDNAGEVRSLLVASPTLGDGKTTFACNLAVALSLANRRVLLVDLSAQRPSVEPRFDLVPAPGLLELLNGEGSPEDFVRRTAFENLGIIGPGLSRVDLAGRLGSREMEDFLEWADDHFDHTIIDSPPMLLMADAKMLAPNVDFVALVVGVKKSSAGMIGRCVRDIEQLGGRILGVALNGVRSMRGGYMKNNQQLYYAYMDRAPQKAYPGAVSGFDDNVPEINIVEEEESVQDTPAAEVVLLSFEDEDTPNKR